MINLTIPVPPSVNKYWVRTSKGMALSDDAKAYKKEVFIISRNAGVDDPTTNPVCVALDFYPPDKRRRDLDNIMKAVFDSLQGTVYKDDSQVVEIVARKLESDKHNPRVEVSAIQKPDKSREYQRVVRDIQMEHLRIKTKLISAQQALLCAMKQGDSPTDLLEMVSFYEAQDIYIENAMLTISGHTESPQVICVAYNLHENVSITTQNCFDDPNEVIPF